MPTQMLSGDGRAQLPRGPLTFTVQVGGTAATVQLEIVPPRPIVTRPGLFVVPPIDGPIRVAVVAASTEPFPPGSLLTVTVMIDDPLNHDPDRVILPAVDVSGLRRLDLLVIEPEAYRLVIYRDEPPPQQALTPLGEAALVAGRRVLAREILSTGLLPADRLRSIAVQIDGSASMLFHIDDGTINALIDIFTGIAQLVTPDQTLPVGVASASPRLVRPVPAAQLADEVQRTLEAEQLTTGFRASWTTAITASVQYVITDSIPADQRGDPRLSDGLHVVLIARDSVRPIIDRHLAQAHSYAEPMINGQRLGDRMLADQAALSTFVASLLSHWTADTSAMATAT